ncbi:MAG: PIN domain-containing protein [Rubrobacter sp.]|nr:PIN domain-containing protein [Rubrobacter sp.]
MAYVFFDTNVLLYMYDDNEPTKKEKAIEVFERESSVGNAVVSTQVLQEFYVNATRKLRSPLSLERAEARVRDFSRLPLVRVDVKRVDVNIILASIARSRSDVLSFWDSLIIEAALFVGAGRVLTEDLQDGREFGGLRIENPFREL